MNVNECEFEKWRKFTKIHKNSQKFTFIKICFFSIKNIVVEEDDLNEDDETQNANEIETEIVTDEEEPVGPSALYVNHGRKLIQTEPLLRQNSTYGWNITFASSFL